MKGRERGCTRVQVRHLHKILTSRKWNNESGRLFVEIFIRIHLLSRDPWFSRVGGGGEEDIWERDVRQGGEKVRERSGLCHKGHIHIQIRSRVKKA